MRSLVAILLLFPVGFSRAAAAWPPWTSWRGSLSGSYEPVPGWPVAWRADLPGAGGSGDDGRIVLSADGLRLEVELGADSAGPASRRWRVVEGWIRLDALLRLAGALRPDFVAADLQGEGELRLSGSGSLGPDGAIGNWAADLAGIVVRSPARGWEARDVSIRAEGTIAGNAAGPVAFAVTVRQLDTSRFGAGELTAEGVWDGDSVRMNRTRIAVAGGEVIAAPFDLALDPLAFAADFSVDRVGLQDLVQFMPASLASSQGRVSGRLRIGWSAEAGLDLGAGRLSLDGSERTIIRLAAAPGFLTSQVPARFALLPDWLGPLARWFQPANPAHETLGDIEMGRLPLVVDTLEIALTPEGDGRGRTASVRVEARPFPSQGAVERVTFQVNVSGPLSQVLRIGLGDNVSLDLR